MSAIGEPVREDVCHTLDAATFLPSGRQPRTEDGQSQMGRAEARRYRRCVNHWATIT
jgi:hypothetical protein